MEAPERIFAGSNAQWDEIDHREDDDEIEYVRADIVEAMKLDLWFTKSTLNALTDWLLSDDCWIEDANGKKLPDAAICGKLREYLDASGVGI